MTPVPLPPEQEHAYWEAWRLIGKMMFEAARELQAEAASKPVTADQAGSGWMAEAAQAGGEGKGGLNAYYRTD